MPEIVHQDNTNIELINAEISRTKQPEYEEVVYPGQTIWRYPVCVNHKSHGEKPCDLTLATRVLDTRNGSAYEEVGGKKHYLKVRCEGHENSPEVKELVNLIATPLTQDLHSWKAPWKILSAHAYYSFLKLTNSQYGTSEIANQAYESKFGTLNSILYSIVGLPIRGFDFNSAFEDRRLPKSAVITDRYPDAMDRFSGKVIAEVKTHDADLYEPGVFRKIRINVFEIGDDNSVFKTPFGNHRLRVELENSLSQKSISSSAIFLENPIDDMERFYYKSQFFIILAPEMVNQLAKLMPLPVENSTCGSSLQVSRMAPEKEDYIWHSSFTSIVDRELFFKALKRDNQDLLEFLDSPEGWSGQKLENLQFTAHSEVQPYVIRFRAGDLYNRIGIQIKYVPQVLESRMSNLIELLDHDGSAPLLNELPEHSCYAYFDGRKCLDSRRAFEEILERVSKQTTH